MKPIEVYVDPIIEICHSVTELCFTSCPTKILPLSSLSLIHIPLSLSNLSVKRNVARAVLSFAPHGQPSLVTQLDFQLPKFWYKQDWLVLVLALTISENQQKRQFAMSRSSSSSPSPLIDIDSTKQLVDCTITTGPGDRDPHCIICYDDIETGDSSVRHEICQSVFCEACVNCHIASRHDEERVTCPQCRGVIWTSAADVQEDAVEEAPEPSSRRSRSRSASLSRSESTEMTPSEREEMFEQVAAHGESWRQGRVRDILEHLEYLSTLAQRRDFESEDIIHLTWTLESERTHLVTTLEARRTSHPARTIRAANDREQTGRIAQNRSAGIPTLRRRFSQVEHERQMLGYRPIAEARRQVRLWRQQERATSANVPRDEARRQAQLWGQEERWLSARDSRRRPETGSSDRNEEPRRVENNGRTSYAGRRLGSGAVVHDADETSAADVARDEEE